MIGRAFIILALASAVRSLHVTQAIAHLQSTVVSGSVTFTEQADGQIRVVGEISGLAPGSYGFHVHQIGDTTNDCLAAGAHFNPEEVTHGGPDHEIRHVGDLGNVVFGNDGVARIDIVDHLLDLNGVNSIVGRALVLHAGEDDLGLTDHPDSLTTGNAGARVGCGVIGIANEVSSATVPTSLVWMLGLTVLFPLLRLQ